MKHKILIFEIFCICLVVAILLQSMYLYQVKCLKEEKDFYNALYLSCLEYVEFNIAKPRKWWEQKERPYEQCKKDFIESRIIRAKEIQKEFYKNNKIIRDY